MNFTKEYIDLCKNNKLQELRKEIQLYDWVNSFDYEAHIIEFEDYLKVANRYRDKEYWLPRSDQLDEAIIKFCKLDGSQYRCQYFKDKDSKYSFWFTEIWWRDYYNRVEDSNLLIAKLKLLLSLLESEE